MAADLTSGLRPALQELKAQRGTHAGLWLDRYLGLQTWRWREPKNYSKDKARTARDELITGVESCRLPEGYSAALEAWRSGLEAQGARVVFAPAQSLGRVIIGLGAKGAGEFGISLHHTWGVPILPGSSLKGIAALGADRYLEDDSWRRREDSATARSGGPSAFDALFGDVEEQGAVIFHDAWLVPEGDGNGLHRDVLTVHHPGYYQREEEPADTESPNPVPFVSASGVFLVALELHPTLDPQAHGGWLEAAWTALREGLLRHGVGSKTNASYGRLALPALEESSLKIARQRLQEEQTRAAAEQAEAARAAELIRREEARAAMTPSARALDILAATADPPEGADALLRWLETGGREALPGLSADEDHVRAVARALFRAGIIKGVVKRSAESWRPWVEATRIELRPKKSPPPRAPLQSLSALEIASVLSNYTHRRRGLDHNKAARALASKNLDAESLSRAISALQAAGARDGHLKILRALIDRA